MFCKRIISVFFILLITFTGFIAMDIGAKTKIKDYVAYAAKLDETTYDGDDLGAVWSPKSTTFKLWSPTASKVVVRLYEKGSAEESDDGYFKDSAMQFDESTGIWSATISGNFKNKYYTYVVTNDGKDVEVVDIYAKAVGANGKRGMIVDLKSTDPDGWDKDSHILVENQTDASVWEVSVKDFSYAENSGVSKENRGKFLAFTEDGTVLNGINGSSPTCVSYLKQLGVNYVQINPFYDFGSVDETGSDEQYNWGYDPVNYNVPEGSYSTNPYDGNVRINECKQMIKALHDAGIGVIMDVVYNHTYTAEDSYFNQTVPYYYHRMNSDGTFSNGSGCSNDTASEHKMFRKFMIDSITYWASEYHIDGFRFDLMGLHDVDTMNAVRASLDKIDSRIIMYGEAWDLQTNADPGTILATQNNMSYLDDRIGAFDDTIRDALKGNTFDSTDKGFLAAGKGIGNLTTGIAGQSEYGWANQPTQTVSYSSCHDNFTLYDKLVGAIYTDGDYRKRYADIVEMTKLNSAAIFTSQGMTFFLAGEEFCRSKDGDENSYKSAVTENMIDWSSVDNFSDVVDYYKGMLQIRNKFNVLRDPTKNTANNINYFSRNDGVVGFTLNGLDGDNCKNIAVILNGKTSQNASVEIKGDNLPDQWVIIADSKTAGLRNLGQINDSKVDLPPSSAMILIDKDSFDKNCKSDQGAVVVDYLDSNGNKVMTENVFGKIGEKYDISPSNNILRNYKITEKSDTKGEFTAENKSASFKVVEYKGSYSSVTFRFVDSETDKEIAPGKVLTNQVGQHYFTESIPAVKGYVLDTDALPENGSGVFAVDDKVVTYKFTKEKLKSPLVKVIYMDSDGNVMDIEEIYGEKGKDYSAENKEYENLELVSVSDNAQGKFSDMQQTVIYNYMLNDNSTKVTVTTTILILAGVIAVGAIAFKIRLSVRKKKQREIIIK